MKTLDLTTVSVESAILYLGTPVVLISTTNEDGSANPAPMSSAFWLGWRCTLGLDASSKTTENLIRGGECVLNLPSPDEVAAVDRLAPPLGDRGPEPIGDLAPLFPRRLRRVPGESGGDEGGDHRLPRLPA